MDATTTAWVHFKPKSVRSLVRQFSETFCKCCGAAVVPPLDLDDATDHSLTFSHPMPRRCPVGRRDCNFDATEAKMSLSLKKVFGGF